METMGNDSSRVSIRADSFTGRVFGLRSFLSPVNQKSLKDSYVTAVGP